MMTLLDKISEAFDRFATARTPEHAVTGIWSHSAPLPPRRHRCYAWTRATMNGEYVENCPCGGIRIDGGKWRKRNSRLLGSASARDDLK